MRKTRENLKFMEDMARLAGGAAGSFGEIRNQIKDFVKEGLDIVMSEMDMVTRAEFNRVERIAAKARVRQEELEKRLSALEKNLKTKNKKAKK